MFKFTSIINQQMGSSGSTASVFKTADTKASHRTRSLIHPPHTLISYFLRITLILFSNILQIFLTKIGHKKSFGRLPRLPHPSTCPSNRTFHIWLFWRHQTTSISYAFFNLICVLVTRNPNYS
jgi:hypothetical protein